MIKWSVQNTGRTKGISGNWGIIEQVPMFKVVGLDNQQVFVGTQDECNEIAAAHNAVIDMAFDSPGNVS